MIRSTFDFKYYQRRDNDAITWNDSNIISIANMTVWLERIRNAHTHTYTFIKMDDPHFSFFFLSFSLSHLLWPEGFDWQTHTHTHSRKKTERRLLWLYPTWEMHMSLVWLLSAYLMFYLIYSRWIFYTICQEGDKKKRNGKGH
jgi:hypothetical protein